MKPSEHCDHECDGDLCFRYRETMALGSLKNLKPCPAGTDGFITCIHDTRTKTSDASIPEDFVKIWNTHMEKHDQQVRKEERERVLTQLQDWLKGERTLSELDGCYVCIYGSVDPDEGEHSLWDEIESLRGKP